jgi:hypothetical protein
MSISYGSATIKGQSYSNVPLRNSHPLTLGRVGDTSVLQLYDRVVVERDEAGAWHPVNAFSFAGKGKPAIAGEQLQQNFGLWKDDNHNDLVDDGEVQSFSAQYAGKTIVGSDHYSEDGRAQRVFIVDRSPQLVPGRDIAHGPLAVLEENYTPLDTRWEATAQ